MIRNAGKNGKKNLKMGHNIKERVGLGKEQ